MDDNNGKYIDYTNNSNIQQNSAVIKYIKKNQKFAIIGERSVCVILRIGRNS